MTSRPNRPVTDAAFVGVGELPSGLYSLTVQYLGAPSAFDDQLPYALGVVRLPEGVQLLARLVPDEDGTWDGYRADDAVEFVPTAPAEGQRPCAWFRRV